MKNGWQTKTLADVCQFSNGLWKGEKPPFVNVGVIRNTNFTSQGTLDDSDIAYLDVETTKFEKRRLQFGDVILEKSGGGPKQPVGRVVLFDKKEGDFAFSNFTAALRVIEPRDLDFNFLHKFLYWTYISGVTEGMQSNSTGIRNLDGDAYKAIKIAFPLLAEQQRIVGILDEAFEGISTAKANAELNLLSARGLFQSVLCDSVIGETTKEWRNSMRARTVSADSDFKALLRQIAATDRKRVRREETTGHSAITEALPKEWRHASIEQLFNLIDYRGKTASKSNTGRRLITARNIKMGFLSDEPITFISEEQYKKWMVRGFPKPGDIFFVTEGHTMGFVALNTRTDDFALAQRTITLQPAIPFNTKFFFYFMLSSHFQKLVKLNATGAAAVGMKASKFRTLRLAFPSFAEQEIIVDKLDDLHEETKRLESIYQRKLVALEALTKSLLHRAFSGEL